LGLDRFDRRKGCWRVFVGDGQSTVAAASLAGIFQCSTNPRLNVEEIRLRHLPQLGLYLRSFTALPENGDEETNNVLASLFDAPCLVPHGRRANRHPNRKEQNAGSSAVNRNRRPKEEYSTVRRADADQRSPAEGPNIGSGHAVECRRCRKILAHL